MYNMEMYCIYLIVCWFPIPVGPLFGAQNGARGLANHRLFRRRSMEVMAYSRHSFWDFIVVLTIDGKAIKTPISWDF